MSGATKNRDYVWQFSRYVQPYIACGCAVELGFPSVLQRASESIIRFGFDTRRLPAPCSRNIITQGEVLQGYLVSAECRPRPNQYTLSRLHQS